MRMLPAPTLRERELALRYSTSRGLPRTLIEHALVEHREELLDEFQALADRMFEDNKACCGIDVYCAVLDIVAKLRCLP